MKPPRMRITIAKLMIFVAGVALMIAFEVNRWRFPLLLMGPLAGALLHKALGGNGVLGGLLSGAAAWAASGVIHFAIYNGDPSPHIPYGLRQQAVGVLAFSAFGAVLGAAIGARIARSDLLENGRSKSDVECPESSGRSGSWSDDGRR